MVDAHVASATVEGQRAEVARIVDELERLEEKADILAEDYAVAVDDKNQLDVEIVKAEERVAAKEAELNQLRGDLAEVAVRSFTGAGADLLGPLFSNADTYTDGLQRDQFSRVALNVGTGTTDDLDELVKDLDQEKKDLESKRNRAAELAAQIESQQKQVVELTASYVEQREAAERRLGDLIAQEQARRDAEALARLQAQAAANASNNAGNGGGGGGGGNGGNGGGNPTDNGGGGGTTGGGDTGDTGGNGGGDTGGNSGGGDSGGGGQTVSVPVSGRAGTAVNAGLSQLGKPYRYATAGPDSYDCSGLTHFAWGQAGVYLPRNSRAQFAALPHVDPANAQPGDLIFYYSPISHVGIYMGGGQLVHAPNSGTVVKVGTVNWSKVTGVGRPG